MILILTSILVLSVAIALLLARKASKESQFEAQEAIRKQDAIEDKQRRNRELMLKYNAPVPTENVPQFDKNKEAQGPFRSPGA